MPKLSPGTKWEGQFPHSRNFTHMRLKLRQLSHAVPHAQQSQPITKIMFFTNFIKDASKPRFISIGTSRNHSENRL
ncbi:hypothetical protein [Rubritalea tangerina]|uniref:hypothetical protein n=1 Tax=Rubritalea tangerina TaxID=430798 RepID=UPI00361AC8AF